MPTPTPKNLIIFFTIVAPPILAMALLLAAAMTGQSALGIVYILGISFLYFAIWPVASAAIQISLPEGSKAAVCGMFNMHPFFNNAYAAPAYNIMIYFYTLFFFLVPTWGVLQEGSAPGNVKLIFTIFMSALIAFTVWVRTCVLKCLPQEFGKWIVSILTGFGLGAAWGTLLAVICKTAFTNGGWSFSPYPTGKDSNRLQCQRPTGNYVCTVSKDGQKVGTL